MGLQEYVLNRDKFEFRNSTGSRVEKYKVKPVEVDERYIYDNKVLDAPSQENLYE